MGYLEEHDKNEIRETAISIIKKCARLQVNSDNNAEEELAIAAVAKTWSDIYAQFKFNEIRR